MRSTLHTHGVPLHRTPIQHQQPPRQATLTRRGIEPGYEQKAYPEAEKRGRLRLVASADGADGSVTIHQDARMYAGLFDARESTTLELAQGRLAYVFVARGKAVVNGHAVSAGDALLYAEENRVEVEQGSGAELLAQVPFSGMFDGFGVARLW